jgi:acetyltransferase-like isoleucine patch superfamily enzyme
MSDLLNLSAGSTEDETSAGAPDSAVGMPAKAKPRPGVRTVVQIICARLRAHRRLRGLPRRANISVYPRTRVSVARGGRVDVPGQLVLGRAWRLGRHYDSQIVLRPAGRFEVTGRFEVYTDFRIWINDGAHLQLGSGYANAGLRLSCSRSIRIGERCALAENVTIRDDDGHQVIAGGPAEAAIDIGDDVWIGTNAVILKGVRIGAGAIVAAGAVVTRNVPERSLVAGVPARVIKKEVRWSM